MESIWIRYWGLEKQFGCMVNAAKSALERNPTNNQFKLLYGSSLALFGKNSEAISNLEPLLTDTQLVLPTAFALVYAHNSCEIVNREAVSQLETQLKEEVRRASEASLNNAAWFYLLTGRAEQASDCADRMLLSNPKSCAVSILKGWIDFVRGKKPAAAEHFKQAASQEKQNTEAVLGEAMSLPMQEGMTRLNQLIVRFPKVTVPLIEKAKLQLAIKDWTQTLDTAARVLTLDANNFYAVKIRTLHHICVEGNLSEGALGVNRLAAILEHQEPSAHELSASTVHLFSAVCGDRSSAILTETFRLAERTLAMAPHLPSSLILIAKQHYLAGRFAEASKYYRSATKVDDSSVEALTGLTVVQMAQNGPTVQVQQQVEFLVEVGSGSRASLTAESELLLLRALCAQSGAQNDASALLDRAFDLHKTAAARHPYGPAHLQLLNPAFLMRLAERYPVGADGSKRSATILKRIIEACPGMADAHLQLAKRLLDIGDTETASKTLQHLLSHLDPTNMDGHLILAQLHISQGKHDEAEASLESVLSYNLEVRERPLYHLLLGCVHRFHGDHEACITSLKMALSMEGCEHPLTVPETGRLYLELSSSLMSKGDLDEASQALQDAAKLLKETDQEGQVTIASADLALLKHDPTLALTLLASITPRHPCYVKARMKMADIHLYEMKDGRAYADCFRQLVETNPTTENLIMLGDAYVAIQEPEQAVETFEHAVKKNPKDTKLMCKLGDVLVKTHQYGKAIKTYRESGQDGSIQLAQLLIRLGQVDHAESVLKDIPLTSKALVLAKVREKLGDIEGSLEVLQEAQEQLGRANPELAAQICHKMAEYSTMQRNYDSAIAHYKRSLLYKPHDSSIQIALAKLYMQVNDWSSCQAVCSTLLAAEPNNEPALLMLADLAFRRVDFAGASVHFSQLLARRPAYWVALARLIEVKRRTAQLSDAKTYLDAAATVAPNQPGLSYCTGLFDWYNGNTNSALHHFNCARNDAEWGQQALHNMVEICLNGNEGGNTALRLLKEMKPHSPDEEMNVRLLTDLVKLTSGEKFDIEQAMNDLTSLASHETLRVGATLGLATGYILQKQTPRARNILKRVAKTAWQFEEAEHLERCWIMLADLHIQAGKQDQATELLKKVLTHNQACHRAHELLGLISEKEQKYLEAGMQYQQAWKLGGEHDPALGFKLAFNMVKGKRYADAITTCHSVLRLNPDYPRIKKEVLEKAISHLRT